MMIQGPLELRVEAFGIFEKMLAQAETAAKPKAASQATKPAKQDKPAEMVRVKFSKDPIPHLDGRPRPSGWVGAVGEFSADKAEAHVRAGDATYVDPPPNGAAPASDRSAWVEKTILLEERDKHETSGGGSLKESAAP